LCCNKILSIICITWVMSGAQGAVFPLFNTVPVRFVWIGQVGAKRRIHHSGKPGPYMHRWTTLPQHDVILPAKQFFKLIFQSL